MRNDREKMHVVHHHYADEELRPHEDEVAELAREFGVDPGDIELTYEVMPGSAPPPEERPASLRAASLTLPERAVLRRLAAGASSVEIARDLGTEPVVVKRHLQSILTKLGVSSRREALELYGSDLDP
jgi:DNA-binding CsgD family transcriptional regulator